MRVWIIAAVLSFGATVALAQSAPNLGAPDALYPRPESTAPAKKPVVKSDYYQQATDPVTVPPPMTTSTAVAAVPNTSSGSMWSSTSSGSALSPIADLSKSPFTNEPTLSTPPPLGGVVAVPACTGEGVARVCN